MKQKAAKRETTTATDPVDDEMQRLINTQMARNQFISGTANMGIRLAVTVVIPIVLGVKLDEKFHSSPSLTLGGMFIAAAVGSLTVWGTVKQINKQQAEEEKNLTAGKAQKVRKSKSAK